MLHEVLMSLVGYSDNFLNQVGLYISLEKL